MTFYDISKNIFDCDLYPGDPKPVFHPLQKISDGESYNLGGVSMCLHTGTHIDAPRHFIENGKGIGQLGIEPFIGECYVFHVEENITGLFIEDNITEKMHRVIFKTGGRYYLDKSGANALLSTNVHLVGIDSVSISSEFDSDETHRTLLKGDIYILEGLELSQITQKQYFLFAAPINTGNAEAAPCRAVLLQKDEDLLLPQFSRRK